MYFIAIIILLQLYITAIYNNLRCVLFLKGVDQLLFNFYDSVTEILKWRTSYCRTNAKNRSR